MNKRTGCCKFAHDYWPMYMGGDERKWGTIRCEKKCRREIVERCSKRNCALFEEPTIEGGEKNEQDKSHR